MGGVAGPWSPTSGAKRAFLHNPGASSTGTVVARHLCAGMAAIGIESRDPRPASSTAKGSAVLIDDDASPTVADEARTIDARPPRRASEPLEPGERYELGATIGRGGMGEVVAAHDLQIGRDVAIKRLPAPAPTPTQLARFYREARIQGRLEHPAIPPVPELAIDDAGRPDLVMTNLAGV